MNNFTTAEFDWIRDNHNLIELAIGGKDPDDIFVLSSLSARRFDYGFTRRLFICLDYLDHPNSFVFQPNGFNYVLKNPWGLLNDKSPEPVFLKYWGIVEEGLSEQEFKDSIFKNLLESYPEIRTSGFDKTLEKVMALAKIERPRK